MKNILFLIVTALMIGGCSGDHEKKEEQQLELFLTGMN